MAKISEISERVKGLRESLGKTQEEFAELFDIKRSTVAGWESGNVGFVPGPGQCIALGNLAARRNRVEEALWFWKQAGLGEQAVLMAANQMKRERHIGPPRRDEVVRLHKDYQHGDGAGIVVLDASLVPHPSHTLCFSVVQDSIDEFLRPGDLFVIESRDVPLRELVGEAVIASFDEPELRHDLLKTVWPAGLVYGRLGVERMGDSWALLLGHTHGYSSVRSHVLAAVRATGPLRAQDEQGRQAAIAALAIPKGCRILGKVIGWFRSPGSASA